MPNGTLAALVTVNHSKCSLCCLICGSLLNLWISGLCLPAYFSSDVSAWLRWCPLSCSLLTSPLLPTLHPSYMNSAFTLQTQPPLTSTLPSIFPWTHTHFYVLHHTDNTPGEFLFGFCCHCSYYCTLTFLSFFFSPQTTLCLTMD